MILSIPLLAANVLPLPKSHNTIHSWLKLEYQTKKIKVRNLLQHGKGNINIRFDL